MPCWDGVHPPLCHPYGRTLSPSMQPGAIHIEHLLCALAILGAKDTIVSKTEKKTLFSQSFYQCRETDDKQTIL